jgi:hypothetical protein
MKMVDMSHVVWESTTVVFPGLNNCHGIVYVTRSGMFAYHAAISYYNSYNTNGKNKIDAFLSFINAHPRNRGTIAVGLYGLCPASRPREDADAELRAVAEGLRYRGPIRTATWNTTNLGWSSTWAVVTRGVNQSVSATIENYRSHQDPGKREIPNADRDDQKVAEASGQLSALQHTGVYTRTDPTTVRAVTDWGQLLLPAVKAKGIFTR